MAGEFSDVVFVKVDGELLSCLPVCGRCVCELMLVFNLDENLKNCSRPVDENQVRRCVSSAALPVWKVYSSSDVMRTGNFRSVWDKLHANVPVLQEFEEGG